LRRYVFHKRPLSNNNPAKHRPDKGDNAILAQLTDSVKQGLIFLMKLITPHSISRLGVLLDEKGMRPDSE
jgi:hypothetical protein